MSTTEIIEQALKLKMDERYQVAEAMLHSLDRPDPDIERVWAEEAMRRVKAYDEGRMETFSLEEVFGEDD